MRSGAEDLDMRVYSRRPSTGKAPVMDRDRLTRSRLLCIPAACVTLVLTSGVFGPALRHGAAATLPPGDITSAVGDGGINDYSLGIPYGVTLSGSSMYVSTTGLVKKVDGSGAKTTVAGGGTPPLGDGGPATAATLGGPTGATEDGAGNVFVSDPGNNRVRKVDRSGTIITFAGNGTYGSAGDGGQATSAQIYPGDVVADSVGDVFIIDAAYGSNRVRKVDPSGVITTYAGGGTPADGVGDGLAATAAALSSPQALALDAAGDLYIADTYHNRVRRVDHATGIISTVAGNGSAGSTSTGTQATATPVGYPDGVAVDGAGDLFVTSGNQVFKVDPSGIISLYAGGGSSSNGLGDGGPATSAYLFNPSRLATDGVGALYIADVDHYTVRKVATTGIITTYAGSAITSPEDTSYSVAGDGGPATAARFYTPSAIALDRNGNLFIAENYNNRLRRVDSAGIVSTYAGGGVGDGLPATSAKLTTPRGVLVDGAGNLLIADCGDARVRKVDPFGQISTIAGGGSGAAGKGNNVAATSAVLGCPSGLLLPTTGMYAGSLLIADCAANLVRKVDSHGVISIVAGGGSPADGLGDGGQATAAALACPDDLALDPHGRLLIADRDHDRVRSVDTKGRIRTIAGDGNIGYGYDSVPATSSHVAWPSGLALDSAGNLFIAENGQARVRKVDANGVITTVAGTGDPGFGGDGAPAPLAQLDGPTMLTLDGSGNLFIADAANLSIREVLAGTPPPPPSTGCGSVVTHSTVLQADIGPCAADGLTIGADNITLDLNGHTITGPALNRDDQDGSHAGIRLTGRQGVHIIGRHLTNGHPASGNGTVTGFDAGIAIIGGAGNSVSNVNITKNMGSLYLWNNTPDGPEFGDGIFLPESSNNQITHNTLDGNGFYDSIGGDGYGTSNNLIDSNVITNTAGDGYVQTVGVGTGIIFNPFLGITLAGRGSSLVANNITNNKVVNSNRAGISNVSNTHATISGNTVENNGADFYSFPGNGIGVTHGFAASNDTQDLVENNVIHNSANIALDIEGANNSILNNDASYNAFDLYDASDYPTEAQCFNTWNGNIWSDQGWYQGTVYSGYTTYQPACTTTGGHVTTNPPPSTAAAAPATTAAPRTPSKDDHSASTEKPARGSKTRAVNTGP